MVTCEMADHATLLPLARGMRPNSFTGLGKHWQEWAFQLKTYVAVTSATMSTDISTAEIRMNPVKMVEGNIASKLAWRVAAVEHQA